MEKFLRNLSLSDLYPDGMTIHHEMTDADINIVLSEIENNDVECENPSHGYGQFSGGYWEEIYTVNDNKYCLSILEGVFTGMTKITKRFF